MPGSRFHWASETRQHERVHDLNEKRLIFNGHKIFFFKRHHSHHYHHHLLNHITIVSTVDHHHHRDNLLCNSRGSVDPLASPYRCYIHSYPHLHLYPYPHLYLFHHHHRPVRVVIVGGGWREVDGCVGVFWGGGPKRPVFGTASFSISQPLDIQARFFNKTHFGNE